MSDSPWGTWAELATAVIAFFGAVGGLISFHRRNNESAANNALARFEKYQSINEYFE
jgi:hypothetical protein